MLGGTDDESIAAYEVLGRVSTASAEQFADRLRNAYEKRRQLDGEIERLARVIATLNDTLREIGWTPVEVPLAREPTLQFGMLPNRSDAMPARRPEYVNTPHAD